MKDLLYLKKEGDVKMVMDKFNVRRKDEKEIVFCTVEEMTSAYVLCQDNKQFILSYMREKKKCAEIVTLDIIKGIIESKIALKSEEGE